MKLFISLNEYVASLPPSEQAFWFSPDKKLDLKQLQETREYQDMVMRRYAIPAIVCLAGLVVFVAGVTAALMMFFS